MAEIARAHTLILKMGADTSKDLARGLRELADELDRGELTVGCTGSPSVGATYSYRICPEQTHDKYFADLEASLKAARGKSGEAVKP